MISLKEGEECGKRVELIPKKVKRKMPKRNGFRKGKKR
jgi:hypothetical protein